jgi:O-Antigen ligase
MNSRTHIAAATHAARHAELYDRITFSLFLVAILLGVTRVGPVTVPVWIGVLPLVWWRFSPSLPDHKTVHKGVWLVLLVVLMVPVQAALGHPFSREDLGVYLPLACTLVVLLTLSRLAVSDDTMYFGLMTGGVFICLSIGIALISACDGLTVPQTFYLMKQKVSIPLGDSNYLAVFLVLLFAVALQRPSFLAVLFAVFTVLTLSRKGIIVLLLVLAVWAVRTFHLQRLFLAAASLGLVAILALIAAADIAALATTTNRVSMMMFTPVLRTMNEACVVPRVKPAPSGGPNVPQLPGTPPRDETLSVLPPADDPTSVGERADILRAAFSVVADHVFTGVPRSYFRHVFPAGSWGAHSWPIDLVMLFGLIGFVAYIAYLSLGLYPLWQVSKEAPVWSGILVGVIATLLFGISEVVLLTSSYDTLLAVLFLAALNRPRAMQRSLRSTAVFPFIGEARQ